MTAHQRAKGRAFEQLVATAYRTRWPDATVRRALQAHAAFEPDVVVEGHPLGGQLWTECQHADDPTPLVKLAQAERDIAALNRPSGPGPYPIVVWRKSGSRTVHLTTRVWVLERMTGQRQHMNGWGDLVITMDFHEWLEALGS